MYDYEYLFATELHKKLKEKIVGGVWVKVYHNELHVKISHDDLVYEYEMNDFAKRILYGCSSSYIVNEIVQNYKSMIINKYFY